MTTVEHAQVPEYQPHNPNIFGKIGKWMGEHKVAASSTVAGTIGAVVTAAVLSHSPDTKVDTINLNPDGTVTHSHATGGELEIDPATGYLDVSSIDKDHNGVLSETEMAALPRPELAAQIDPRQLVAAFGVSEFDHYRLQELGNIQSKISADQASVLNRPDAFSSGPKESWTDQQILNAIAIDQATAMAQTSKDEAKEMLPAVRSPKTPFYQQFYNNAGSSFTLKVFDANGNPYPKPKGQFMGIADLSPNARLIYGEYKHNGTGADTMQWPAVGILVDLVQGADGQTSEWREMGEWNINDTEFQTASANM